MEDRGRRGPISLTPYPQQIIDLRLQILYSSCSLPLGSRGSRWGPLAWKEKALDGQLGLETKSPLALTTQPLRQYQAVCVLPGSG